MTATTYNSVRAQENRLSRRLYGVLFLLLVLVIFSSAFAYDTSLDIAYRFGSVEAPKSPFKNTLAAFQTSTFTGAATYSYAVEVPPGTNGLAPSLSLTYNSHSAGGKAGWVGAGWDIPLDYIQRDIEYTRKDTSDDTFDLFLDGGKHDLVDTGGGGFHTRIESWLKVEQRSGAPNDTNQYWLVTARDGTQYRFGYNRDSEHLVAATDPSVSRFVWRWSLDQITDTNGNTVTLSYDEDPHPNDRGTPYLTRIQYNRDQRRRIEFVREDTDRPDSYLTVDQGSETRMSRRLRAIRVLVDGALVREYVFGYGVNETGTRSLLTSITPIGNDGTSALPPTRFDYQALNRSFGPEQRWEVPGSGRWIRRTDNDADARDDTFDVDGDGLPDLVDLASDAAWGVARNTGAGFAPSEIWTIPAGWDIRDVEQYIPGEQSADTRSAPMDFNHDGRPDHVYADRAHYEIQYVLNTGSGFADVQHLWTPVRVKIRQVERTATGQAPNVYETFMDINGDGRPDIVESDRDSHDNWHVWRNTGDGWADFGDWHVGHGDGQIEEFQQDDTDTKVTTTDMNSDGLPDIVEAGSSWRIWLNTGSDFLEVPCGNCSIIDDDITDVDKEDGDVENDLVDINGDGLPDYLNPQRGTGAWQVAFNKGNGFTGFTTWETAVTDGVLRDVSNDDCASGISGCTRRDLFDITGDGQVDVVRCEGPAEGACNGEWQVAKNRTGYADLLVGVTESLGGRRSIAYRPSHDFTNTHLPQNFWLVSSVTNSNGLTGPQAVSANTQYSYAGGLYDFPTREFRGFSQVTETRADGSLLVHRFHQDEGRKGKEYLTETKAGGGALLAAVDNAWASSENGGVYETLLTQTDEKAHDGVAENPKVKRTELAGYDAYGNLLLEIRHGDLDVTGDESRHYSEFALNPDRWIVGKPNHVWVTDGAGVKRREQWLYYDGASGLSVPPVAGNLTREVHWLDTGPDPEWRHTYDSYGNRTSTSDPEGRSSQVTYDPLFHSFPVMLTNAKGQQTTRTYDPASGELLSETDLNGYTTSYEYDTFKRRSKEIRPYDSPALPTVATEYLLDGSAPEQVVTRKRELSGETGTLDSFQFVDGFGNLIQQKSEAEDPVRQIVADHYYDALWRVARQSNPYLVNASGGYSPPGGGEYATVYSYDGLGRPTVVENPDGTRRTRIFDHWTVTEADEDGHAKSYVFDHAQRPVEVVEHVTGEDYHTRYVYDSLGKLVQVTDHPGNVTRVQYDSLGRKTALDDPDLGLWTYAYDGVGNLTAQTDARGITTRYSYDALDRKTREDFPNDPDVLYDYDQGTVGTLSKVTDAAGDVEYGYDQRLRKTSETRRLDGNVWTTQWAHDALDRPIRQIYPNGEVAEFVYNGQGLLEAIPGVVPSLDYNAAGLMTEKAYANGITTSYAYDLRNQRLTAIQAPGIQDLSYTYDAVGNVLSIADGVAADTEHFTYDDLDRLIGAGDSGYAFTYRYNAIGNMLEVNEDGFLVQYGYGEGAGPHAVTGMTARAPRIGSFVLHYGDAFTLSRQVPLNAVVFGDATEYLASEREDFAGASWTPLGKTPLFTLSSGFGPKTVHYKVRNGSRVSEAKLDSILFAPDLNGDGVADHLLADADEDGAPDAWETEHKFNPGNPADGAADTDGDGLTNADEARLGTDPRVKDSDGDGVEDGAELAAGTDPTNLDTDGDGLADGADAQPLYSQNPGASETFALRSAGLDSGGGSRQGAQFAVGMDRIGLLGVGMVRIPSLQVSPVRHDFGAQVLEATPGRQIFGVRNVGAAAVQVGGLSLAGAGYGDFRLQADACSGETLGAGESCAFEVAFSPMYSGASAAVVRAQFGTGVGRDMAFVSGQAVYLDSDGDGLPDAYEEAHQLDPHEPADAALDKDGDGVDNRTEFEAGTNPNDPLSTPATLKLILSRQDPIVPEGGWTTVGIRLSQAIASTVRVDVARIAGDADISVASGMTLWFTPENWGAYQQVTLAARSDPDTEYGVAELKASAKFLEAASITATEQEPVPLRMQRGAFNSGSGFRIGDVFAVRDGIGILLSNRIVAPLDTDRDGLFDYLDPDDDNDGVPDDQDAFPLDPKESVDTDHDRIGNNADPDDDNDGVLDGADNCPLVANPDQADDDRDGIGNLCDPTPKLCWACLPSPGGWRAILK